MAELTEREHEIIDLIGVIRAEYHSCTAAEVSRRMGISTAYLSELMQDMRDRDLVSWVEGVPGSVIVVEAVEPARHVQCECGWPDEAALAGHRNAKHRAPKASASAAEPARPRSHGGKSTARDPRRTRTSVPD